MMKLITQQAENTLKSLHQNCFRFPIESRPALRYLSQFNRFSDSDFNKRGSDSVFVLEKCPSNQKIKYRLIDQKGTMTSTHSKDSIHYDYKSSLYLTASNSCNGMVLIHCQDSLFLCNPSTGYMAKVLEVDSEIVDCSMSDLYLCYDESSNDYKAVLLYWRDGYFLMEARLKEKRWTKVNFPFKDVKLQECVSVKNMLQWVVSGSDDKGWFFKKIFQFDPVSSIFEELPSPPMEDGFIRGIGVLEGCLWIARVVGDSKCEENIEVLRMEEYGVKESWTSMFVSQNVVGYNVIPLLLTRNGEFLYLLDDGSIMAYNLETKLSVTFYTAKLMRRDRIVPFLENFASP